MQYLFEKTMLREVAEYADMLECLRRGTDVLYDRADAMLIREKSGTCILGATTTEAGIRALTALPAERRNLVVRDGRINDYTIRELGFTHSLECVQVYYAGAPKPAPVKLVVQHPAEADWDQVRNAYHLIDEEPLREHFLSPDFFCGYYEGHLAAFAGLHSEGALGMLYVFPQYRRMGFAEEMSNYMIDHQLALGRYVYAHIIADNEASLALQRKTGMTFARRHVYWLWEEKE